jgi:hypothetical protein
MTDKASLYRTDQQEKAELIAQERHQREIRNAFTGRAEQQRFARLAYHHQSEPLAGRPSESTDQALLAVPPELQREILQDLEEENDDDDDSNHEINMFGMLSNMFGVLSDEFSSSPNNNIATVSRRFSRRLNSLFGQLSSVGRQDDAVPSGGDASEFDEKDDEIVVQGDEIKTDDCMICLQLLTNRNKIILCCGHSFHWKCVKKLTNQTCPTCRAKF